MISCNCFEYIEKYSSMKEFTEPSMNDFLNSENESDNIAKRWDTWYSLVYFFNFNI